MLDILNRFEAIDLVPAIIRRPDGVLDHQPLLDVRQTLVLSQRMHQHLSLPLRRLASGRVLHLSMHVVDHCLLDRHRSRRYLERILCWIIRRLGLVEVGPGRHRSRLGGHLEAFFLQDLLYSD